MASNSREEILAHALDIIRGGGAISFDSVAQSSGLSKPGLMYHFRTKEALMLALVDSVLDRWEEALIARLGSSPTEAVASARIGAYLDWSLSGGFDETDLVAMSDPKLRRSLTRRWAERLAPWLIVPDDVDPAERTRLLAARLLADGGWLAEAASFYPPTPDERAQLRVFAHNLLKD